MVLYGIGDLHLSFGTDKPMDIFRGWDHYTKRLETNWCRLVTDEDVVVLPGDLSWALKLEDSLADFHFLESLPGRKVILKGNHDLWWPTVKKMSEFFRAHEIETVSFVFNNCFEIGDYAVCGTRGWNCEKESEQTIVLREAGRLETSIRAAVTIGKTPIVFMHYPPVFSGKTEQPLMDVLERYGIKDVYHGHIHGAAINEQVCDNGIRLHRISCDGVNFTPVFIKKIEI